MQQNNNVLAYLKNIYMGKKDSKGKDQYDFTLEPEHAMKVAGKLMEMAQAGTTGRLSFRVGMQYSQRTGRQFQSGFVLVSEVKPQSAAPQAQRHYQPVQTNQAYPPAGGYQQPTAPAPQQPIQNYAPQATNQHWGQQPQEPEAQAQRIQQSIQSQGNGTNNNDGLPF